MTLNNFEELQKKVSKLQKMKLIQNYVKTSKRFV